MLNVGSAHVGEFGSRAAIAQAKGELVEALPSAEQGGVAVLNVDDDAVIGMRARTDARVVTYGLAEQADVAVTMGCGDECPYIPGKRYINWELPDPKGRPVEEVRATRDEIDGRVRELAAELDAGRG